MDEPTTGLHPADVRKLMVQLNYLVEQGNTIILVEHDLSVIAASDWIIEIGPEAGARGGKVICSTAPKEFLKFGKSRTAPFLANYLDPSLA